MFDELDRLRAQEPLRRLLSHYVQGGTADREAWQDRVMELEGVEPQALTRLHGELIACGWIDMNTATVPVVQPSVVPRCYRATSAAYRAVKQLEREEEEAGEAKAA